MKRLAEPFLVVFIVLFVCISAAPSPSKGGTKAACGYESCPETKPGVINVHVVPHTHDDMGWLKTVDQYYYGTKNDQKAGVQYILDSVVKELQKSPHRKFIYVEMGFFTQWWREQSNQTKAIVHQLVQRGQLEFINGGWCMNDEATPHYSDIIDQMTWGHKFLNETFGECGRPRVAWQIDPFGHSREQASLFAQMYFDGVFFARLDWVDKDLRLLRKEMEMIWQASNSLGPRGSLFSGALFDHYSAPDGFCFDFKCRNNEPIIDNKDSPEYNVPLKMATLIAYTRYQASRFNTNNIMFTMGDDFHYMSATMYYKNIDKMIKYANQLDPGINMFYSTPSCYVKAKNDAGFTWPTKSDDFFPYSSSRDSYWTGYFTSRPTSKGMIRQGNNVLQVCKQLHSLSGQTTDDQNLIDPLKSYMGEAQHHDAVTGTEKQHVTYDYSLRLHKGMMSCEKDVTNSLKKMLPIAGQTLPDQKFCLQLNVSQCNATETSSQFVATIYNPKSQMVTTFVRLPVTEGAFTVVDPDGLTVDSQLVPIASFVRSIKERASAATHELVFEALNLPPLGYKSYYIQKSAITERKPRKDKMWVPNIEDAILLRQQTETKHVKTGEKVTISNQRISVNFDGNGLVESLVIDGQTTQLKQNLWWYYGSRGDGRPSGAYVFRPNGTDAQPISNQATVIVQQGNLVQEVHQMFSDWASQIVRIYKDQSHVEIEWVVGPIPVDDGIGKEIINRIETSEETSGEFYTDSNGRQTLKRQRDFRPSWNLTVTEPVAGNYYPINSHIYITNADSTKTIALVNDRAQGGTSLHDGEIELMVHRRLLQDDSFGVGEPLNEPGDGPGLIAIGTHILSVSSNLQDHPMSVVRPLAQKLHMKPWLMFAETDQTFQQWSGSFHTQKSGLVQPLPSNVHILTLEPWRDGTHLLRLEHVYDVNEHNSLAQSATVVLDDLLAGYTITSAEETTLSANQWIADASRFEWLTDKDLTEYRDDRTGNRFQEAVGRILVTLNPMDIKTFVIEVQPKAKNLMF